MPEASSAVPWIQLSRVEIVGVAPLHDLWALLVDVRGWGMWNDFYSKAEPSGRFTPQMTIEAVLKDGSTLTWTLSDVAQGEKICMTCRTEHGIEFDLETRVVADGGLTKLTRILSARTGIESSQATSFFEPIPWVEAQQRFLSSTVEVFELAMPESQG